MKFSTFNNVIPVTENSYLLFNARSSKYVVIKKELMEQMESPDTEKLKELNPELYENLVAAEAIVDDDRDEFGEILDVSKNINTAKDVFQLMINPTMNCNFRCWYCYETHIPGSKLSPQTLESIKKLVQQRLTDEVKSFYISFFGGEPLLYYKDTVQPLIKSLPELLKDKELQTSISFTSNAFLITDEIISDLKETGASISFQITLDGDRERHNQVRCGTNGAGSYDKILENVKKLTDNEIYVILRVNYTEDNLQSVMNVRKDIDDFTEENKKFMHLDFHQVWQDRGIEGHKENCDEMLDDVIEEFSETGFRTNTKYNFDMVNNSCYADKVNQVLINYNGDIFKCTARDFTTENRLGYLSDQGEVVWEKITPEERLKMKFSKQLCRSCSIMPLCGGLCIQRATEEQGLEKCEFYQDTEFKKNVILNRFHRMFIEGK